MGHWRGVKQGRDRSQAGGLASRVANAAKRPTRRTLIKGKVNLNTASTRQLSLLPRVGKRTAQAIIAHRAKKRFRAVREIMKVKGIGKRTFLRLKRHLSVTGPNTIRKVGKAGKRGKRRAKGRRRGRQSRR